jgi:predicted HTH transcriptional regulator
VKIQEQASSDAKELSQLRKLVAQGEGLHLEFKRKASFPEKIIREIIAFANTEWGVLLIGVDDDQSIPGVKYPDEEILTIEQALAVHCRPPLIVSKKITALNEKKFVVLIDVPVSDRRPHRLMTHGQPPEIYIRVRDMSVKASREMQEIVRRLKSKKDVKFNYGPHESTLMKYLAEHEHITLAQFCRVSKLNRFIASRKLITLVLAHVLKITPGHPDIYQRI